MRFTALAARKLKEMYRDPFTLILSILGSVLGKDS